MRPWLSWKRLLKAVPKRLLSAALIPCMASRRASWDSDNGIVDEDIAPATDKAETAGPATAPAGDISDSGADGAVTRATLLTLTYYRKSSN